MSHGAWPHAPMHDTHDTVIPGLPHENQDEHYASRQAEGVQYVRACPQEGAFGPSSHMCPSFGAEKLNLGVGL